MRHRRTSASVLFGVASVLLTANVAFAAWVATGSGDGSAKAISAVELTTSTPVAVADLYPGATGDVVITINNPNPYPVEVSAIDGDGAIVSDKGAACDAATGVTFTDQTGAWDVAANSSATFTLAGAVAMSNDSDDSCQGATFTIPVSLTGASDA